MMKSWYFEWFSLLLSPQNPLNILIHLFFKSLKPKAATLIYNINNIIELNYNNIVNFYTQKRINLLPSIQMNHFSRQKDNIFASFDLKLFLMVT